MGMKPNGFNQWIVLLEIKEVGRTKLCNNKGLKTRNTTSQITFVLKITKKKALADREFDHQFQDSHQWPQMLFSR